MKITLPSDVDIIVLQKSEAAGFGKDVDAYVAQLIANDVPNEVPDSTQSEM